MSTLAEVDKFFRNILPSKEPPGRFNITKGMIAADGMEPGEKIVFSYDTQCVYIASTKSGRLDDTSNYDYPHYFIIDVEKIIPAKGQLVDLETKLHELGVLEPNATIMSRGWRRLDLSENQEVLILSSLVLDRELSFREKVKASLMDSNKNRTSRLAIAPKIPEKRLSYSPTIYYERNPDVVAEVLSRAKGVCERCNRPAPFIRRFDNSPYLEVHHRKFLSEGGEDTVENAVALCPNCHREAHFG